MSLINGASHRSVQENRWVRAATAGRPWDWPHDTAPNQSSGRRTTER